MRKAKMGANKKIIFVIDDNKTMQNLLKTLLEFEGFSVFCFGDISLPQLMGNIKLQKPNVILSDVHLISFDGFELLEKLYNEYKLNIPVILTSGEYLESEAIQAGASAFLMKPFMPDELYGCLSSAVHN